MFRFDNTYSAMRSAFRRNFCSNPVTSSDPQQDIKLLANIARFSCYMRAQNGNVYWYYVPKNSLDIDVAKYLFERNGVIPTFRNSRYGDYNKRNPVLRMKQSYVQNNKRVSKFMESIKQCGNMKQTPQEIELMILKIRSQMYTKDRRY